MSDFIHLHCHTEYSLLDGAIRLGDLCAKAKDYGMNACAITDHGNMFGAAQFQKTCAEYGIKPIFGCEVYMCQNRFDTTSEMARRRYHLILLARNADGYHNLVKIVSAGWQEGFFYKPRVDWDVLKNHAKGITCLSACLQGAVPQAILSGHMDTAREMVSCYSKLFDGHYYLELQHNGLEEQRIVNDKLLELAETEGIPVVATNDCHYLNADDVEAHDVLLCIGTGSKLSDTKRFKFRTDELYYKSPEQMSREFSFAPEALENTMRIAEECNFSMTFGKHFFPQYALPAGASIESEFCRLAEEGLERRFREHPAPETLDKDVYRKRLKYEIDVILSMGFPDYFLIVQEFINWAKNNGVPTGPGRGSAAGSLVAWSMRITNLDPLPYNLLFERFLNNERVSLPDIDVDFCERRRFQVIRHMADIYGEGSVSQIAAYSKLKARAVLQDVGRVLDIPFQERNAIVKFVPAADPKIHIKDVLANEPDLKALYDKDERIHRLIDISQRLEGLTRQVSMHAAGLVVSDMPMTEYLPLFKGKHDEQVTQFDGPMVEQTGLVKFDFLGLKTMTLIQDALDNIRNNGRKVPNLDTLPFTDEATYELYSNGDTDGIFQVESSGMRQYLRMLRPSCFEDIIAMLALYRPGPLGSGMVDEFIKRKHGEVKVVYPHPSLESCLKDTYGVIVYQEQVMQIAQIIANYTLGGADLLRRAMGKKKAEAMAQQRAIFVSGAAQNGIGKEKADEIFDLMEKFAAYGFNKSHSAAYAVISYYTAYLKQHYTGEFMAALLTSEISNRDKLLKYISCCRDRNIEVRPPSVNFPAREFSVHDNQIIYGLGGIKGVGDEAILEISKARQDGPFVSFLDLCERVNLRKVTKRVLEALIKSGALDCTRATRQAMLACFDTVIEKAQKKQKSKQQDNGMSLFSLIPAEAMKADKMPGVGIPGESASLPEFPEEEILRFEKENLGFYLTSHPLQNYVREARRINCMTLEAVLEKAPESEVATAVLVTGVREVVTKSKGERMAFVQVEDLTGHGEVTVFPRAYTPEVQALLHSDAPLWLKARTDKEQDTDSDDEEGQVRECKLIAEEFRPLAEVCQENRNPLHFWLPKNRLGRDDMLSLRQILEQFPGPVQVIADIELDPGWLYLVAMGSDFNVTPSPELHARLTAWLQSEAQA